MLTHTEVRTISMRPLHFGPLSFRK